MIIATKPIKYSLHQTQTPFKDITHKTFGERNNIAPYNLFVRYIGYNESLKDYKHHLQTLDQELRALDTGKLKITKGLTLLKDTQLINQSIQIMDNYLAWDQKLIKQEYELYSIDFGFNLQNDRLEWTKKKSFKELMNLYDANHPAKTNSTRKNFGVKIIYWMNAYLKALFENDTQTISKCIYYGPIKKHEVYFLILLAKLGVDVLYINPVNDLDIICKEACEYSTLVRCENLSEVFLEFPKQVKPLPVVQPTKNPSLTHTLVNSHKAGKTIQKSTSQNSTEMSYEQLAQFAESVVLIKVYDKLNQVVGGGSGVVINKTGYIITNFHVVYKGQSFGVIFENDTVEYKTNQIIKYNQDNDLALIKIDKYTKPIILSQNNLVRGQRIISIGSPLGLLNTISEGIVSGFRSFDQLDMVQISAPISPGSSGGALLDMYGNLAGITTSGFNGQNLNLAVPRKYIQLFVHNLI